MWAGGRTQERRTRRRTTAGLGFALTVLVVLAACGTGSSSNLPIDSRPAAPGTAAASTAPAPVGGTSGSQTTTPAVQFATLPPGSTLPSEASCAARVRQVPEIRETNTRYNETKGHPTAADPTWPLFARVTGDFTGTTDEIIQWAACKWGIDEDVVRAQAAKETYWQQTYLGDFGTDPTRCAPGHPIGADGERGKCPESIGMMQTRAPYLKSTIADAAASTAYNLDLSYAIWRSCYEGQEQWLNTVEHGATYQAGDLWGCVGRWYAGRWHTSDADTYSKAVRDYFDEKIWKTRSFINYRP
jgi:autotransporter family porin